MMELLSQKNSIIGIWQGPYAFELIDVYYKEVLLFEYTGTGIQFDYK